MKPAALLFIPVIFFVVFAFIAYDKVDLFFLNQPFFWVALCVVAACVYPVLRWTVVAAFGPDGTRQRDLLFIWFLISCAMTFDLSYYAVIKTVQFDTPVLQKTQHMSMHGRRNPGRMMYDVMIASPNSRQRILDIAVEKDVWDQVQPGYTIVQAKVTTGITGVELADFIALDQN